MFVVTVDFTVKAEGREAFMAAMTHQARTSLEREPGCRQFDVCVDPQDPHRVFLYENYTSPEAFEAHLASDHFREFDARVGDLVVAKSVRTWRRVFP